MEKVRNVFPGFTTFGGAGTSIQISYAESLVDENNSKGHRDSIRNKRMRGIYDVFIVSDTASTSHGFKYETPFFRTARYLELKIVTQKEPIRIGSFFPETFAYPFKQSGSFTDSTEHNRTEEIWNVGWQTARMCAQETYVDCPYYEQLQYVGDTRIQALISLYVSGDDWLMRKAIKMFDESRTTEGLTASRYPSNVPQVIPPYSLAWVEMVGDYWMHRPDTAFVRARLEGVRAVLNWYEQQQLPNGLIGPTPYWNFVDWTDDWPWNPILRIGGVPDLEDGSSIISLQYVSALRTAAKLFAYFGDATRANAYNYKADGVAEAVSKLCWNAQREMFSDTPKGVAFSQHANIMALLTDLVPAAAPEIMKRGSEGLPAFRDRMLGEILTDEALTPVSEYFRFFLVQAMYHTGNAHLYQDQLKIWEAYLDQGFTTFPEKPGETRSDCHAWSASPNYDLPATLAGIRPSSPGFQTVSIRPAAYGFEAKVPHPNGMIIVQVSEQQMGGYEEWDIIVNYRIELPPGVTGTLSTGDKSGEVALVEGVNEFQAIWQGY